jgi:hypothetical protein
MSYNNLKTPRLEEDHDSKQMVDRPLRSSPGIFVLPYLNVLYHCLTFPSLVYLSAVNRAQFTMDFRSTYVFSVRKTDNNANFAAVGVIDGTITQSVETRTNTRCPVI